MLHKVLKTLLATALCAAALSGAHAQTVKVGATPTAVPFNFLDPKTNTLQGVMIDIAQAVGKQAGFKAEVMPIPFASLVPALQTNKIDIIASAFAKTPQRAEVVDFTQLVVEYGGHDDQLSRLHWGMDRFRVYAIIKLLRERAADMDGDRLHAAREAVRGRCAVLLNGALRRENDGLASVVRAVMKSIEDGDYSSTAFESLAET